MKITEQQALVLFDIAKTAMNSGKDFFAGYSREEIIRLLNDIIKQQDNETIITVNDIVGEERPEKNDEEVELSKASMVMNTISDNFWD